MYNFFIDEKDFIENKAIIVGKDYNHIKNVLRMQVSEIMQICNKQTGESFSAKIESIEKDRIICDILNKITSSEPKTKVTIYQGIPKSDKMEYIIQKSVELGAFNIVPVEMKYCVAKINNPEKKLKRWQDISEAAAKQSKRTIIPKIENPINIKQLCEKMKSFDLCLLAYENEKGITIKHELNNNININSIAVIVGPEGGFDYSEVEMLQKNGAKCVSLGKRILRTETAPIAMLSMIMYEYEL